VNSTTQVGPGVPRAARHASPNRPGIGLPICRGAGRSLCPVRVPGEDCETRFLSELRPSGPVFLGAGCRVALVVFCASEGRALSPKAPRSEEETSSEDCPDPGAFEQSGGGWAAFSQ
jgi:hypothetical protein